MLELNVESHIAVGRLQRTFMQGNDVPGAWVPSQLYPNTAIERCPVPRAKLDWRVDFDTYNPPLYESPELRAHPEYADDPDPTKVAQLQERLSQTGTQIRLDALGRPLNPRGRTGIQGRGVLGRWGPNHKVYCLFTRFKRAANSTSVMMRCGKPVLEFLVRNLKDNDETSFSIPCTYI